MRAAAKISLWAAFLTWLFFEYSASLTLAYQQTDTAGVEILAIMDPTNPQRPPHRWPYPRTGTANAEVRLGIISADGGPTTWGRESTVVEVAQGRLVVRREGAIPAREILATVP